MRKFSIVLLVFFFGRFLGFSQISYERSFGFYGNSIELTRDGGYILGGTCTTFGSNTTATLVRTTNGGDTVWTRNFGQPGSNAFFSVKQSADNGFICAGATDSTSLSVSGNGYLLKTDSIGAIQWSQQLVGLSSEKFSDVLESQDHGYFITGTTRSAGAGNEDLVVARLDSMGVLAWSKVIGGSNSDLGLRIVELSNGNIAVLAKTNSFGSGLTDVLLVVVDPLGNPVWQKTFGTALAEDPTALLEMTDSTMVVYGSSGGNLFLLKVDFSGNLIWAKAFDSGVPDYSGNLLETGAGDLFLSAYSGSSACFDPVLFKTDAAGNPISGSIFLDPAWCEVQPFLTKAADGGIALISQKGTIGLYFGPVRMIKTDSLGNDCSSIPQTITANSITVSSGTAATTITTFSTFTTGPAQLFYPVVTDSIVCQSFTGIEELGMKPKLFIYPNPATAQFTLQYEAGWQGMELRLTDILGRIAFQTSTISADGVVSLAGLSRGMYTVSLIKEAKAVSFARIIVE